MSRIVLERSLKGKEKSLLDTAFPSENLALVADSQTFSALGERVMQALPSSRVTLVLLGENPLASEQQVEQIRAQSADAQAFIAVGSGTINDLCKRAAFLDNKPYAVFPTAPSMNGYVSATASLKSLPDADGNTHKESFSAAPPVYLFADLEVLAASPLRLIRSGLGDSLCRSTAQADWLLSHLMLGTTYDRRPFALLAPLEMPLVKHSAKLVQRDIKAIEILMRTLVASGQGMTLAGGSYPASQGEHMIAHAYETLADHATTSTFPYHGELIAVTTLEMARLQEQLLSSEFEVEIGNAFAEYAIQKAFPQQLSHYRTLYAHKRELIEAARAEGATRWSMAREAISNVTLYSSALSECMEAAGLATTVNALQLDESAFQTARTLARYTRERFTFLDLESAA